MTQQSLNDVLNAIINQYTGQRIGFTPGVEIGQCPAPVCYYLQGLGCPTPPMANARADGWGTNFPTELSPFFTHEAFQNGKAYPKGTILMWNSPPVSHIAIVVSDSGGSTVEVFEQNADPDGSACHTATRTINTATHTATYALVPIIEVPAPTPTCTYTRITPVTLQTNKSPTNWWELNWTDINKAVAATQLAVNTPFPAVGQAHHVSGQQYYMIAEDFGNADTTGVPVNNNGVNVNDLSPIPPPPVVIPVPATPQLINSIPKVQAPDMTPYKVVVDIKSYNSAPNALTRTGTTVTLKADNYYKFNTLNGMISLTKTPGLNMQWWINPTDNVVPKTEVSEWGNFVQTPIPPKPLPVVDIKPITSWKDTYKAFNKENEPVIYKALMNVDVDDLDTKRPWLEVDRGQSLAVYGTVTFTDGVVYGRLKTKSDPGTTPTYWYAVPMVDIRTSKSLKIIDYIDLGYMKIMDFVRRK